MWISTSTPSADLMPKAWPVGKAVTTVPANGEYTLPLDGTMPMPLPSAPEANTLSFTSASGTTAPLTGALTSTAPGLPG